MKMRICYRAFKFQYLFNIVIFIVIVFILRNIWNRMTDPAITNSKIKKRYDFNHDNIHYLIKEETEMAQLFKPKSLRKIDWHNYTQISIEASRVGIGEQGKPAKLSPSEAALERKLYDVNGYNGALSDKIPLNRSLPDIRHKGCKSKRYIEDLPDVSVVIPFHDEHFSTLVRTAYSVLSRSPKHLIREIFLVDDASTKEELKHDLDMFLFRHMPKVQVLRLLDRSGLIAARLAGARAATGDVLIFLDAHSEANVNWLPPLLEPIALNYRTSVCPFIDVVAHDSFEYRAQDEGARGAFDWEFFYKRLPLLPKDLANMPEPFESPVMAGGLFAISRKFFWELGGYDPGLDIWGGEQYELSFKIWQCGGRLVDAPCSRVGHVYRKFAPFPNPGHGDFVGKNYRRVAEVWMDEYAKFLYLRRPQYLTIDPGDVSKQREIREKLKCKPFRWFMTQIAFDLTAKYPVIESKPFAEGKVRPVFDESMCVNAKHQNELQNLKITSCNDNDAEIIFVFSWHKDVRSKTRSICWDVPDSSPGSAIVLYTCHGEGGNQLWRYDLPTKQIRWSGAKQCLTYDDKEKQVVIMPCIDNNKKQQWLIDEVNEKLLQEWKVTSSRVTGPVEAY